MGSFIEINDTLQITTAQGFPEEILNLARHKEKPITLDEVKDTVFSFQSKKDPRIYPIPPTRCFLVHNIHGKWLFWGKAHMLTQTITSKDGSSTTSGTYRIIALYDPTYQEMKTRNESPEGKSYF